MRFIETFLYLQARSDVVVQQMRKDVDNADKIVLLVAHAVPQSLAFYGLVFLLK